MKELELAKILWDYLYLGEEIKNNEIISGKRKAKTYTSTEELFKDLDN